METAAPAGFTLMEMVVAVAIFVTTAIIVTDIYLATQRAQTKLVGQTKVQTDARFVMEAIAREVRMNEIDYDYIAAQGGFPVNPVDGLDYLPLRNSQGNTILFARRTGADGVCEFGTSVCLAVQRDDSEFASITPKGVSVDVIKFYIYPEENPFVIDTGSWQYPSDSQPRVTIVLVTKTTASREIESSVNYLQTTVSSRQYKRF